MGSMISFSGVTKTYGKGKKTRTAVEGFSLDVSAAIFGFLGQNGAGKTTIMKMATGLLAPTKGTIMIGGKPAGDPAAKEKIGFMPETPYFYERMKGLEFLNFCGELFKSGTDSQGNPSDPKKFHEELLRKVGLYDARNYEIRTYSKGMRQRLGFAQALVNNPRYLFLDEPLDGLDPIGRREMKEVILGLKGEGKQVFLSTHILYDVEGMCDEVGVIHGGKLLYAGSVSEFRKGAPLEDRFIEIVREHESHHSHAKPISAGKHIA
jgi:ABC-2 type transport system ATP-binding protein